MLRLCNTKATFWNNLTQMYPKLSWWSQLPTMKVKVALELHTNCLYNYHNSLFYESKFEIIWQKNTLQQDQVNVTLCGTDDWFVILSCVKWFWNKLTNRDITSSHRKKSQGGIPRFHWNLMFIFCSLGLDQCLVYFKGYGFDIWTTAGSQEKQLQSFVTVWPWPVFHGSLTLVCLYLWILSWSSLIITSG